MFLAPGFINSPKALFPNVKYVVELELSLPPRLKFSLYFNFLLYIQYGICPPKSVVLTLVPLSMMKVLVQGCGVVPTLHADSAQAFTSCGLLACTGEGC